MLPGHQGERKGRIFSGNLSEALPLFWLRDERAMS